MAPKCLRALQTGSLALCWNWITPNLLSVMFFSLIAAEGVNVFKGCNCRERSVMFRDYTSPCWRALCFLPTRSLGVVLSRGHGEYILLGNTSVEEGRLIWHNHTILRDKVATLNFTALLLLHSLYVSVWQLTAYSMYYLVSGLHDLLQPDLSLANEW